MPAPARTKPYTHFPYAIECPRGIVGVYTDKEVDALLQGAGIIPVDMSQFPTKAEVAATYATKAELAAAVLGGTADLSAYSTTVQIAAVYATQAELAKVYTKAEVDAIINALPAGTVDLSDYATTVSLTEAVQDLSAQIAVRYTKDEVDSIAKMATDQAAVWDQDLRDQTAAELQLVANTIGGALGERPTLTQVEALIAAIPAGGGDVVVGVDGNSPTPSPATPQGFLDAYAPFAPGAYYFRGDQSLVLVRRDNSGGVTQLNILRQDAAGSVTAVKASDYVPVAGTTNPPKNRVVNQNGTSWFVMEAALPGDQFRPIGAAVDIVNQQTAIEDLYSQIGGGSGGSVDLSSYYTIVEADEKLALKADKTAVDAVVVDVAALASQQQTFLTQADIDQTNQLLQGLGTATQDCITGLAAKADKTSTYTKAEVDAAVASMATGGTVDLSSYAQLDNYAQEITANLVKAQAFVFTKANTTMGFTRTPEYPAGKMGIQIDGPTGEVQFLAYMSDLAGYAPLSTTTLITTQLQALFDSIYTKPEADDRYAAKADNTQAVLAGTVVAKGYGFGDAATPPAALTYVDTGEGFGPRLVFAVGAVNDYVALRSDFEPLSARMKTLEDRAVAASPAPEPGSPDYYRKDIADAKFMTKDEGFSKVDMNNAMALSLYSRAQVDARLAAISPMGATSINDPAFADLRVSILSEVKRMLAGGTKMPPPDIDWTWMVRMDGSRESVSTEIQARMIGGFIELKGTLSFGAGSGSWVPLRLPPQFPLAEIDASYPLAMRLVGSAVTYGYCSVSSKSRDISCSPGARSSEANFSGIRFKADY